MVTNQGKAPAGELDSNLMAAAGMETDADKAFFSCSQTNKFQSGFFDPTTLALHHKDFVFLTIFPQQVLPVTFFRWRTVDHGHIFLYHGAFLNCFGELGGSLLCAGKDHNTAYILIQPVDGKYFAAKLFH